MGKKEQTGEKFHGKRSCCSPLLQKKLGARRQGVLTVRGGFSACRAHGGEGIVGPLPHISLLRVSVSRVGSQATLYQAVTGEERSQERAFHFYIRRYRQGLEVY
jgi:hypothetical protein